VDPLQLEKNFDSILEKPTIAKNVRLHFLLSANMYVRSSDEAVRRAPSLCRVKSCRVVCCDVMCAVWLTTTWGAGREYRWATGWRSRARSRPTMWRRR
jgi:hypothetical protein